MATTKPNPLEAYDEAKTAARTDRKQNELQMWQNWQDNGQKPEHLEPLMKAFDGVIGNKVRAWKPKFVPESSFRAELQGHAIRAFESYDPARGAALNTHVENRLKRALRYGNRHANFAYIPEGQSRFIGPIDRAKDALTEELGREPTSHEIHEHLMNDLTLTQDVSKLTPKKIETIQAGRYGDIPASRAAGEDRYDESATKGGLHPLHYEEGQIAVAANILPQLFPTNTTIHDVFHHTFGTGGREVILSTNELAAKLGKSPAQISRLKTQMAEKLQPYLSSDNK